MSSWDRNSLSVTALGEDDIPSLIAYWHESSDDYLHALGVRRDRLPSPNRMREFLLLGIRQHAAAPVTVVIRAKGHAVGVHELTHLGDPGGPIMHAHIWSGPDRGKGIGRASYLLAAEYFFARHPFDAIRFETPKANAAANRLKAGIGLEPAGEGEIQLALMAQPLPTWSYRLLRTDLPALMTANGLGPGTGD